MQRPFTVIANWKMNKTIQEALAYAEALTKNLKDEHSSVWLAVPFTAIFPVREKLEKKIMVGAQNMNDASSGAFTGEVAALMIKDAGGEFVLLGHSERRQYFGETDEFINRKVIRALEAPIKPVLCIGEGFEAREAGETRKILEEQLSGGLKDVDGHQMAQCLLAYEPIWAIGTGKSATPEVVEETHAMIRSIISDMFDEAVASNVSVLYGGSVSVASAEKLAQTSGVDGFLVGTASLDPEIFAKIVHLSERQ